MSQLLDFYRYNSNNPEINKLATEYLLRDTLNNKLHGNNKIKDIDGMDMESKLAGNIIPGMIYTFIYKPNKDKNDIIDNLNIGDKFPIVLCCGIKLFKKNIDNKIKTTICIQGLNLNYLSSSKRLKLLNTIHTGYKSFYENEIYKQTENNSYAINNSLGEDLQNPNFLMDLADISNIELNNCFRLYEITNCVNIRLIEYNLWKYIPFYNPKRYITNLTIEQIKQLHLIINNQ